MKLAQYVKFREEKFCGVVCSALAFVAELRQEGLVED